MKRFPNFSHIDLPLNWTQGFWKNENMLNLESSFPKNESESETSKS
jgi:hypothetical protein